MKTLELSVEELLEIHGGDLAYDLGRAIHFIAISGGGFFVGNALADWAGTTAINNSRQK